MYSRKLLKRRHPFVYAFALFLCARSRGDHPGQTARGHLGNDFVRGAEVWIASQKPIENVTADETCHAWEEKSLQLVNKDPFDETSGPDVGPCVIRTMTFDDIRTANGLGRDMFTNGDFSNMGRTWDDFSVVDVYVRSRELCFVAEATIQSGERGTGGGAQTDEMKSHRNATIVGFLLGRKSSKAETGPFGSIDWIAVVPEHRRKGVATRLVTRFRAELRRLHRTSTVLARHVAVNNAPAIRLLESSGLRNKMDYVSLTLPMPSVTYERLNPETLDLEYKYEPSASRIKGFRSSNRTGAVSFVVRRIMIEDLVSIRALGDDLIRGLPMLSREWNDEEILNHYLADSDYCVVATVKSSDKSGGVDDGRNLEKDEFVVGFAMGTISEDKTTLQKYGYFVWLGCSSDYQGRGVASELFSAMLELFAVEDVGIVIIDTQSDNVDALRFFRKHGFGDEEHHLYLSNIPLT